MIPLPCNPDQISIGYGLRAGTRGDADHPAAAARADPQRPEHHQLRGLSGAQGARSSTCLSLATAQANTEEKLAGLLCCLPQAMVPEELGYANSFRVVILQFLDRYNFDLGTVKRSCVHFVTEDGQIIPFDTYNTFYREGAEGAGRARPPSRARGEGRA